MTSLQSDGPLLTIAVCTLDRPDDVRRCLLGFQTQDCPGELFEVLVVDNGPSEEIKRVVTEFSGAGISIRYASEPRRGLTYARRRAWKSAIGAYVAFVDDDAIPCPWWVTTALGGFQAGGPVVAAIGGPVLNVRQVEEPIAFCASPGERGLDLGTDSRRLEPTEDLWGCNFVFRRATLAAIDAFGEPLGHRDGRPGANEDILVQRQIDLMGLARVYEPQLQIVHNTWRTTASSSRLDRLAYYTGVDNATMARLLGEHSLSQRTSAIRVRIKRLKAQTGALVRARRVGDTAAATAARRAALQSIGTVVGYAWPPVRPQPKPTD